MESWLCTFFSGYFSEHVPQQPTICVYPIHALSPPEPINLVGQWETVISCYWRSREALVTCAHVHFSRPIFCDLSSKKYSKGYFTAVDRRSAVGSAGATCDGNQGWVRRPLWGIWIIPTPLDQAPIEFVTEVYKVQCNVGETYWELWV
jgi:hypothetical protein